MEYRVFYTDQPLPQGHSEPDYTALILVGHDTKDEAMEFACRLLGGQATASHAIVCKIEGPDRFILERKAIEWEYLRRTKGGCPFQKHAVSATHTRSAAASTRRIL